MTQHIERDALKALLDGGEPVTLVEALPSRYYEASHLPGAVNLPHDEVMARAESVLPDRDARIVVYCANTACQNSRIAAEALKAKGYSNVFEYVEGKADWEAAGYPLETSAATA